jgi:aspartate aminotransferase
MDESATLKMAQLARNLKAEGHQVVSLTLGEPDFDTPQFIKDSATLALNQGFTKYTPVAGLQDLRQAVCNKFLRDNQLHYKPENIVVSNGAKQSFANICLATLDKGDEAVVLAPFWVSYKEIIELAEGKPVFVKADIEQNYKPNPTQIRAALNDKTRLFVFSSPCNPTGAVFSKSELAEIVKILVDFPNVLVVSDEIYEYINFTHKPHFSIAAFAELKDRVVIINGFSKGFSMTGWRLGYIAAPKWLADACAKIQGQFTSGASSFGQKAAITALEADLSESKAMTAEFLRRRDLLLNLLSEIKGLKLNCPDGAFYLFPDISYFLNKTSPKGEKINTAEELCLFLLYDAKVALVSGEGFGADTCLRISYAAAESELRLAAQRLKDALNSLV